MTVKIDIAIACNVSQGSLWWVSLIDSIRYEEKHNVELGKLLAISSAVPDHNKNFNLGSVFANPEEKYRNERTDANRVKAVDDFLSGDSEYLFFLDDDTTHPAGTISRLINLGRDFVAGLYFNPNPPKNPIAYLRRDDGLYHAYYDYPKGALSPVDSVGMGCTLIHRSVFERLMESYEVFQRPTGSLVPVLKSSIYPTMEPLENPNGMKVFARRDNVSGKVQMVTELVPVTYEDVKDGVRPWPFFGMEYGRTEDHFFCELCAAIGIRPWLDTTVVCGHWKLRASGEDEYRNELFERKYKGRLEMMPHV